MGRRSRVCWRDISKKTDHCTVGQGTFLCPTFILLIISPAKDKWDRETSPVPLYIIICMEKRGLQLTVMVPPADSTRVRRFLRPPVSAEGVTSLSVSESISS